MARLGFCGRVVAEQELAEGVFDRMQSSIDPDWIEEALQASGTATLRRRRLPAEQVIWLVLGMALYRNRPIDEIVAKLDLALPGRRGPVDRGEKGTRGGHFPLFTDSRFVATLTAT